MPGPMSENKFLNALMMLQAPGMRPGEPMPAAPMPEGPPPDMGYLPQGISTSADMPVPVMPDAPMPAPGPATDMGYLPEGINTPIGDRAMHMGGQAMDAMGNLAGQLPGMASGMMDQGMAAKEAILRRILGGQ